MDIFGDILDGILSLEVRLKISLDPISSFPFIIDEASDLAEGLTFWIVPHEIVLDLEKWEYSILSCPCLASSIFVSNSRDGCFLCIDAFFDDIPSDDIHLSEYFEVSPFFHYKKRLKYLRRNSDNIRESTREIFRICYLGWIHIEVVHHKK